MSNDLLTAKYTEFTEARRKARAFVVYMMGGQKPIQVDADELSKIQQTIASGGSCWVRQGNFNARGYSHIVEDGERLREYYRELDKREEQLKQDVEYNNVPIAEAVQRITVPNLRLKNIFQGVDLGGSLPEPQQSQLP